MQYVKKLKGDCVGGLKLRRELLIAPFKQCAQACAVRRRQRSVVVCSLNVLLRLFTCRCGGQERTRVRTPGALMHRFFRAIVKKRYTFAHLTKKSTGKVRFLV